MASTATRGTLCREALSLAGRSSELLASCRQWMNFFLLHVGTTFRFSELRKTGTTISLAQGTSTVALPTDFGLGMEKMGMLIGPDNRPLAEYSFEDFSASGGFPRSTTSTGRPDFYYVDRDAGVFKFSNTADQAYSLTPIYFKTPTLLSLDESDDTQKVWIDNDLITLQGLMWFIYIFTEDPRENAQEARFEKLLNQWKRETVKMGGTARVQPTPNKFRNVRWGGQFGI